MSSRLAQRRALATSRHLRLWLVLLLPLLSPLVAPGVTYANPTWPGNPSADEIAQAFSAWLSSQGPAIKESQVVNYHDTTITPAGDGANGNEAALFWRKESGGDVEYGSNRLECTRPSGNDCRGWSFTGGGCSPTYGSPSFSALGDFITWCVTTPYARDWVIGTARVNEPPAVGLTMTPDKPTPDDTIVFVATATDPENDPLSYEWSLDGKNQSSVTGNTVEWKNPREGTHSTQVKVSDGQGGSAEASVSFAVEVQGELTLDLNIGEGQRFTQGDDLWITAMVSRGTHPVSGASVKLWAYSPANKESGRAELVTDDAGQAEWRSYFTVDAAVGVWQIVAKVESPGVVGLIRKIELVKYDVTPAQVQLNIETISALWQKTPEVLNGRDYPSIGRMWWPKGIKVDLAANIPGRKDLEPYTCSALMMQTLKYLNRLRFSTVKDERLLMAGVDYGPVNDGTGLIHTAVAIYPHGSGWWSGYVLEPWFNQQKESWGARTWSTTFMLGDTPGDNWLWGNLYQGEYPTTGSDGGYYPQTVVTIPPSLGGANKTRVLTYSPVRLLVTDAQGRRAGRLADGTAVNEIPEAQQSAALNEDGTWASLVVVPDGDYVVSIVGTGDGPFHLVTATDDEMVNYGELPIKAGEHAAFSLRSTDLHQPLRLPDGSQVLPQPGLIEEQGIEQPTAVPTSVPTREPAGEREVLGMAWEDFLGVLWLGAIGLLALGLLVGVVGWLSRRKSKPAAVAPRRAKASATKKAPARTETMPSAAPSAQAETPIYCGQCGALNEPQDRFCTQCGQPLPRV